MPGHRQSIPVSITIATSTTVSAAVDCLGYEDVVAVKMPSAYTAGDITFQTSDDGVSYYAVILDTGAAYTLTAPAVDEWVVIDHDVARSFGRFVKIVTQNAQLADRVFELVLRSSND